MASIVVFAAHNDDHALAMGGTIAKHFRKGDEVHTFIGSFGELSHPHLKPEIIRKTRVREAQRADRSYGGNGQVVFLGLREFKFHEDFERKKFHTVLRKRLRALRPSRIYIPATNDTHGDHQMIAKLVLETTQGFTCDVYCYYVYPALRRLQTPRLYVDVSDTYRRKLEGLPAFRSQIKFFTYAITNNIVFLYALAWNGLSGFLRNTRFVETFYKVR